MSGIVIGILLSSIVWWCCRRFRNRKPERNPEGHANEIDTTYEELDLEKMNTEDNYQSSRVNTARNDTTNGEESAYTDLSKTRDEENHYQSLS
jgi:hypothetical protein